MDIQNKIDFLLERVQKQTPNADVNKIRRAYECANKAHDGQKRKNGDPYIIHPVSVAEIIVEMGLDTDSICAGLLHDCIEDTAFGYDQIKEQFGESVADLVNGVTRLGRLHYSKEQEQVEDLRKMLIAMAKDIRVILIKLADRLHNMRTMQYMKVEKQRSKSLETMEIYAPIAHRLGMQRVKWELEDLSLKYLDPVGYKEIVDGLERQRPELEEMLNRIKKTINGKLDESGIKNSISARVKHIYSIYRKMFEQNKSINEIYDICAVRVIVESVADCYNVLGYVHDLYKPIPGRFKDYIAMPKPNMYQSLHTTLIGPGGRPFEIQIRTFEMHRTAEYGIAAHWKYKEASNNGGTVNVSKQEEEKLSWLRQILEWQKDMSDGKEFMSLLKSDLDLFAESVYCFTPAGDVKNLPNGSTPIDFAYSIHSAVGNKMIGARANGKLVNIDYVIQNGDRIEIITSQNSKGPSRDWLKIVKSAQAKNKINQWFRNELKEDNITRGKELMAAYCKSRSITLSDLMKPSYMESVMRKYGFRDWDSALAAIGHGGLKEGQVVNKLQDEYNKKNKRAAYNAHIHEMLEGVKTQRTEGSGPSQQSSSKKKSGIIVEGLDDLAVRFPKCCSPVPGDEIVGFVTRGRGVSIHRTDCVNMIHLPESEKNRLIDAEWSPEADQSDEVYPVEIVIYCFNRSGVLLDVSRVFTENKIDVKSMNVRVTKQDKATLTVGFETSSLEQLDRLIVKLKNIESVTSIERSTNG